MLTNERCEACNDRASVISRVTMNGQLSYTKRWGILYPI